MEEVQQEVRTLALKEFESCVSDALNYTPTFKYVGMKMIEFAMREPKLFQLIYMREREESQTYEEMVVSLGNTVEVCIQIMQRDYGLSREDAGMLFKLTWLHTFSICALVANKVCHFSMEEISEILSASFQGALMLIKSGTFQTIPVNKQEK